MSEGYVTSFFQLFDTENGPQRIDNIEVPLIQRDYAQGRSDPATQTIRHTFLDALYTAVVDGQSISLDFVYGEIRDGRFEPLDGQQRLTTLFLLHWYIGSRAGKLDAEARWTRFRYATRPSAERFCELLGMHAYPGEGGVAQWIRNQNWYLHTWNYDPTVQSMLTMLDAIHKRFDEADFALAWDRLTSRAEPAVSFHVLPLAASQGSALYIKMNSRGKPLTRFENFKAHLEQVVAGLPGADDLASRMDIAWPDIFWPYSDGGKLVDDQLLRYLEFMMEVLFWRDGQQVRESNFRQVEELFDPARPEAAKRLAWLIAATDIWEIGPTSEDRPISSQFANYMEDKASGTPGVLPIYRADLDLLSQCCKTYSRDGNSRQFGWPQTLLLHAFIVHRMYETPDFPRRLRMLRNLIEASSNELRLELMPGLIGDVERLVSASDIRKALDLAAFNAAQCAHELKKVEALENEPTIGEAMARLEDHQLLRGNLFAFDLDVDAATFIARAAMFNQCFGQKELWRDLAAGLLATGNYSRLKRKRFYFGSSQETSWREIFTGGDHQQVEEPRKVLSSLLDELSWSAETPKAALDVMVSRYLASSSGTAGFDWRYYMVRYPKMRDSQSGIYVSDGPQLGYCLSMLNRTQLNSWYRDAVLSAIVEEANVSADLVEDRFYGYAQEGRRMKLVRSDMTIRCVMTGYQIEPPADPAQYNTYQAVAATHGIVDGTFSIAKLGDGVTDAVDRIDLCGRFLGDLIAAKL